MPDLPAEVTFGKVVGRFRLAVPDSVDAGSTPDAQADSGMIKFVPRVPYQRVTLPEPETISNRTQIYDLDSEGYLVDKQGARGVWMGAGYYDVTFTLKKSRISPQTILVTAEHTELDPLDLSIAIPAYAAAPLTPGQYSELSDKLSSLSTYVDAAGQGPAGKVDKGSLVINVKDYGAVGNGVADDTAAIQAAINAAYAAGVPLFLPGGKYRCNAALKLPREFTITGTLGVSYPFRAIAGPHTLIETYGTNAFEPASAADPVTELCMSGVRVRNLNATPESTTVFAGIRLRGCRIEGNIFEGYGTLMSAPTGQSAMDFVSTFSKNFIVNLYTCFNSGAVVDSSVESNYIKGYPGANPVCFRVNGWAMTTISGNFIDFFRAVFTREGSHETVTVTGNRFDHIFRVVDGTGGSFGRMIVSNNLIRNCRAATISLFPSPTAEMTAGPWVAFDWRGVNRASVSGNLFTLVDVGQRYREYPNYCLRSTGNVYETTGTKVDWNVKKSGDPVDLSDVSIEEMQDKEVGTLPSPSITSSSTVVTFHKHRLIYNGVPVFNDNGVWKKYDGTPA